MISFSFASACSAGSLSEDWEHARFVGFLPVIARIIPDSHAVGVKNPGRNRRIYIAEPSAPLAAQPVVGDSERHEHPVVLRTSGARVARGPLAPNDPEAAAASRDGQRPVQDDPFRDSRGFP